jgi:hypothetical protein
MNISNTSTHRDGTDDYVADCGRQAWRNEQMCKVDPRRAPKTFRVLSRCTEAQLKQLMHVWDRSAERKALVNQLYQGLA